LDSEALHRIPYIDDHEVSTIREKIDNIIGCPPSSLFETLQKTCFEKMKFELYPEFVKQEEYRKAFQLAIKVSTQVHHFNDK
jgi:hypothetical protein